jgi:predicted nuclease of predicted toxin-antitoxin system
VDECTGPSVARWLREQGHEVFSVYEQMRGAEDDFLLEKAYIEGWIIVTNDKDFGEKVVREGKQHSGVIILRLKDEKTANKILRLLLLEGCRRVSINGAWNGT